MARGNDSVLLQWQRDGLQIDKFIFHIISLDDENAINGVVPLDEVELSQQQHKFFLDRLKETSSGNKYLFLPDAPMLKEKSAQFVALEADWVAISRVITNDFAGRHKSHMSPGVFVIAEVTVPMAQGQLGKLVYLVKLDHKRTMNISYKEHNGVRRAVMEDLPKTLSESKSAVQKSALIDVHGAFGWDVLAWDKNGAERPTRLSEYFEGFLGVSIYGTPAGLTQTALKVARNFLASIDKAD